MTCLTYFSIRSVNDVFLDGISTLLFLFFYMESDYLVKKSAIFTRFYMSSMQVYFELVEAQQHINQRKPEIFMSALTK